jgi:hypothetical protein
LGLLQPIGLGPDCTLLFGRRRLAAIEELGRETIRAVIFDDMSEVDSELATIHENLMRRELTVLERSQAMARCKELYEAAHPATKRGGDRTRRGEQNAESAFCSETARKTGRSRRAIEEEVAIGEGVTEEAAGEIKGTPVEDHKGKLSRLAKTPKARQPKVARELVDEKPPKPGTQKSDPRMFSRLKDYYGAGLRKLDALQKTVPADKFHRHAIEHGKGVIAVLEDWQKATR